MLVEHKSTPDAEVVLQVLGYIVRIWRGYVREGTGRDGRAARLKALPPIIPLLVYSGSTPWTGPTDLGEVIATDTPTLTFLRGPGLILRQWAQMGPDELSSVPVPQASLLTLTERAMAHVETLRDALAGNPVLQCQFVEYIMADEDELDAEDLRERFRTAGPDEMEGVVATIAEKLEAKGEARGIAKGRAEGVAEGEAKSLIRLLENGLVPCRMLTSGELRRRASTSSISGWIGFWMPRAWRPLSVMNDGYMSVAKKGKIALLALTFGIFSSFPAVADLHNHSEVREIQEMLVQCGFEPGPIDGHWGHQTARAAADYIRAHGGSVRSGIEVLLINQVQDLVVSSGGPCPQAEETEPEIEEEKQQAEIQEAAPNSEIWECTTIFESSQVLLTADHDTDTGTIKMGTLPTIETFFGVEGLDRVWLWPDNSDPSGFYQFLIGPRGATGLQGYYIHFPHSTMDEMVESQASYYCAQTAP